MKSEVETRVPKDIRSYKTKVIGSLTMRQLICYGIVLVFDVFMYTMVFKHFSELMVYILIFLDLPVLAFLLEPNGMKFETYLKDVVFRMFFWPRYRRNITAINPKQPVVTETRNKKETKKLMQQHPDMQVYK